MADDSDLERSEPASQRRIEKAREEGDVPRSRELDIFLSLAAGVVMIAALGKSTAELLSGQLASGLARLPSAAVGPEEAIQMALEPLGALVWLLPPMFAVVLVAAVLSPGLVGGLHLSSAGLRMRWERLNPAAGLARMFSVQSLVELLKAVLKAALVAGVATVLGLRAVSESQALSLSDLAVAIPQQAELLRWIFAMVVLSMLAVVAIDAPFQMYSYAKKLRMTKQQVKEEMKESDGNPETKAKIRSQQRAMARSRMMSKVPTADVVVTNPTHYAVALQYAGGSSGRAPRVVAKGADAVAARIREIAQESGVPLLEAPPLARALHRHVDLDAEIPAALYNAVAQVLAYVFALKSGRAVASGLRPPSDEALGVPEHLDPAAPVGNPASARATSMPQTMGVRA